MNFPSPAFYFRVFRLVALAGLLLISFGVGALWIASHIRPWSETLTYHGNVYHLASAGGHMTLVVFSTTAEDEMYRQQELSYWMVEAVAAPLAGAMLGLLLWERRHKRRRGFPLQM